MTNDQIREILLANGFTIKPGHNDLKPYVYGAVHALLARVNAMGAEPKTYTTQPGESVAGIALRQLGDEKWWKHLLACNPDFIGLVPHEYFPVSTVLTLPSNMFPVSPTAEPVHAATMAVRDVLAERQRQFSVEGWTPEHDDQQNEEEMAIAAACYAESAAGFYHPGTAPETWPWLSSWWKPLTPRRDLVKAAALILAEIERLDRASEVPHD